MLREAVKHVVEVIALAGNAVAQAISGQSGDGSDQSVMRMFRFGDGLAPRGRGGLGDAGKILRGFELRLFPTQTAVNGAVPRRNVQDEFPDAVNFGQRFGRRGGRIYVAQQFEQRGTMPCAAVKGAAELVGDAGGFGIRLWISSHGISLVEAIS